jgi:carbon starvation protein CstA
MAGSAPLTDEITPRERKWLKIGLVIVVAIIVLVLFAVGKFILVEDFHQNFEIVFLIMTAAIILEFTTKQRHRVLVSIIGSFWLLLLLPIYWVSLVPSWGHDSSLVVLYLDLGLFFLTFYYYAVIKKD